MWQCLTANYIEPKIKEIEIDVSESLDGRHSQSLKFKETQKNKLKHVSSYLEYRETKGSTVVILFEVGQSKGR